MQAVSDQGRERVDRVARVGSYLEVQVRTGGVAGRTDRADDLAGPDPLTPGDGVGGLVAVPELGSVLERDDRAVAVGAGRADLGHRAVRDGVDRGPARRGEVQAGVTVRPQPRALASSLPPNEKLLAACYLLSQEARSVIRQYFGQTEILHVLELRSFFEAALKINEEETFSVERALRDLDPRIQKLLTELSFAELGIIESDAPQQALHCLEALEETAKSKRREEIKRKVRELEPAGKFPEAVQLAEELNRLGGRSA